MPKHLRLETVSFAGISIDISTAWLKKFCLCEVVTGEGVGIRDPDLVFLARRIYEESVCGDLFSPMVVDALMVELLVSFVRRINIPKRVAPGWVQQIAAAIRHDPSHPYKLEELSKLVGYHPVHIARTFRIHWQNRGRICAICAPGTGPDSPLRSPFLHCRNCSNGWLHRSKPS